MKLSRVSIAILFASILLMVAAIPSGAASTYGPREDDMAIYFYTTQEAAYGALEANNIDFVLYDLTSAQADAAFENPNIVTVKVPDAGYYEFDLNNNWTITDYPLWRSPMNYSEMRKACAYLSDKDYFVGTLLGNKAQRIDQMIAAPFYSWANETMTYPYYPWEYSPSAAKTMLDSKFPVGATANPYYDPLDPLSSPTLRQYPLDHSETGQDLDPLKFKIRVEHNARLQGGRSVMNWLRKMGVPVDPQEASSTVLYPIVMQQFNYHFYTGGWSTGRFPPLTLFGTYHSVNAFPGGGNYVTGGKFPFVGDNASDPRLYRGHPRLDAYLYTCNYALNYSQAVGACKLAAGYMTEYCVNVPCWSVASYWGWRNTLLGMVNQAAGDPEGGYTCLNFFKVDGSPIRCGTINVPTAMNIVYSSWVYDYSNLDRMNAYGGVDISAYNAAVDQVGFVDYFETTTWDSGTKTKVIMSLREDNYFAEPDTGTQVEEINASHYFFSSWLLRQIGDGWLSSGFVDLDHIVVTGPYDFEIYFTTLSYWNTYYCQPAFFPMDLWMAQGPTFINSVTETFVDPVTPGVIDLNNDPIWFTSVTMDGTPLTMFTDYNIENDDLYIYTAQGTGTLSVTYNYVPATALQGYFVGGLGWNPIAEGGGMYYMTNYGGVAGPATYKANRGYYCVTPPLGEVDFVKVTEGPDTGNYRVDIYDLYYAAAAFGTQGVTMPDPLWFPGCDVAPTAGFAGYIDIYDIATIGSKYGMTFDPDTY